MSENIINDHLFQQSNESTEKDQIPHKKRIPEPVVTMNLDNEEMEIQCKECNFQVATVQCQLCDTYYCMKCNEKVHHSTPELESHDGNYIYLERERMIKNTSERDALGTGLANAIFGASSPHAAQHSLPSPMRSHSISTVDEAFIPQYLSRPRAVSETAFSVWGNSAWSAFYEHTEQLKSTSPRKNKWTKESLQTENIAPIENFPPKIEAKRSTLELLPNLELDTSNPTKEDYTKSSVDILYSNMLKKPLKDDTSIKSNEQSPIMHADTISPSSTPQPRTSLNSNAPLFVSKQEKWLNDIHQLHNNAIENIYTSLHMESPTHHILVRNTKGALIRSAAEIIYETAKLFGDISRCNIDFIAFGFVFFSFYELSASITAASELLGELKHKNIFNFSKVNLMVEPCDLYFDDTLHSGKIVVHVNNYKSVISSIAIKEYCMNFGLVSSVMKRDINEFVIEYNDIRVIEKVLPELNGKIIWGGPVQAHLLPLSPTQKTKLQQCLIQQQQLLESISSMEYGLQASPSRESFFSYEFLNSSSPYCSLSPMKSADPQPTETPSSPLSEWSPKSSYYSYNRSTAFTYPSNGYFSDPPYFSPHSFFRLPSAGRHDQGYGEYSLCIETVRLGLDTRTTLMIRNIPNKYTQQMLLNEINRNHQGLYDFFLFTH